MNLFLIWLAGFIVMYIIARIADGPPKYWGEVGGRLIISCFSWAAVFIIIALELDEKLKKTKIKPPKWL